MVGCIAAFATGIWAAGHSDPAIPFMMSLTGLFFLVIFCSIGRLRTLSYHRRMTVILAFLWFMGGLLRMGAAEQSAAGSVHEHAAEKLTVQGTIVGEPKVSVVMAGEWRVRYLVNLDYLLEDRKNKESRPLSGGVILTVRQQHPLPDGRDGDTISAAGTVRLFHPFHNPGQPDWSAALAARGIDARITAIPQTVRIVRQSGQESLSIRLKNWRSQVREALQMAMPDDEASLILGMLFGGYDGIDRQTVRDFAATGIVHILSVSGAHIALVAGGIFWLTRRLSVPAIWSAVIAASAMAGYGCICGFSAPVIRSVVMGLIGMAAIGAGRVASASRALSVAALAMLIYEPRNLFDISFQLSVGCTAGLLYLQPGIASWLRGLAPKWAVEGIAATLSAQLAVIPLLSWYFSSFPVISLLANLVVVPLLETVILVGLFGALLAGGAAEAAHFLFIGASGLTGLAVEINRVFAGVPGGSICLPAMGFGYSCLYYVTMLWIAGYGSRWGCSPQELSAWVHGRTRRFAILVAVATGLAVWGVLCPGQLQVHFIDVGQGDATLVVTPHGRAILVDAGGALGPNNGFDIGEQVVVPYLRHYGVQSVDWLILTHNHQDHAGGAAAVAELLGVHQVLLRQEEESTPTAVLRLKQAMRGKGMQEVEGMAGIRVDGVTIDLFQVGNENPKGTAKGKGERSTSENGRSTVVRVEYGRHSFLLTGDLEGESEKKLEKVDIPPSTVLKVGHHGGRKSTRPEFLAWVAPQYAVVSVGADNQFGHPHPETMARLQEWPADVFRTDRDGAVVFLSDGETLKVEKTVH